MKKKQHEQAEKQQHEQALSASTLNEDPWILHKVNQSFAYTRGTHEEGSFGIDLGLINWFVLVQGVSGGVAASE